MAAVEGLRDPALAGPPAVARKAPDAVMHMSVPAPNEDVIHQTLTT